MSAAANPHEPSVARVRRGGGHVAEMQRRRLLAAAIELVAERGAHAASVAAISQRAGVSRKTFYDLFPDREACLLAAFEQAVERIAGIVSQEAGAQRRWRDRMRAGLAALLVALDREPAVARLAIVEALGAGEPTLHARRQVLERLVAFVEEGCAEARRGSELPPLTAEGVVGAVFSVVHARMIERDPRPLGELSGSLTAMIVQPYLGTAAAQKELHAYTSLPAPMAPASGPGTGAMPDPFRDLPLRLTYRTARVLASIAESPGASSKQVAASAGVSDQGQMSRLLARLERFGLVENNGGQPVRGEAKAWKLTGRGEGVLQAVGEA